jgi:hypothetical protein
MYTWDPRQRRHSIGGPRSLAFSHDGTRLAIGGMGQVGNIDHLEGKSRVEVFDWRHQERLYEFANDKFKGLVEHVQFHPQNDWLLTAGGDNGGFITIHDLAGKTVLKEDKAPMHVHALATDETWENIYMVGHGRLVAWTMQAAEPAAAAEN